jgi:TetR/AcrR family transcriptional regulator, regulator of biofilm formation and stress response
LTETVDQRLVRGERRRAELIEATLQVIERDGVGGVSHRAVAKLAGVSPSAAIHHFATLDDLLVAALVKANEESIEAVDAVDDVDGLAELLAEQASDHRSRFVAVYELYLLAARRPALRDEAHRWMRSVRDAAERMGADEVAAEALTAALDGLGIQALLTDEPPDRGRAVDVLREVLPRARRGAA